jgi:phosphoserine phosphatase
MKISLAVFDMDGVIFEHDNFWMQMHEAYGTLSPGLELTEKYLEKDVFKLAEEVIGKLWTGKPAKPYLELVNNEKYNSGAEELIKKLKEKGIKTLLLTSGPEDLALRAKKEIGVDYIIANKIIVKNDLIAGYEWLFEFNGKGNILEFFCKENNIDLKEVVCVGDNENDITMMKEVGLAISFNSKSEKLKQSCDIVIEGNDLMQILGHIK